MNITANPNDLQVNSLINQVYAGSGRPGLVQSGDVSVAPGGGTVVVGPGVQPGRPVNSAVVETTVTQGVFKPREMSELNFAGAGDQAYLDLGQVTDIIDFSGTRLAVDKILMISPDGVPHDLGSLCRLRSEYQFIPAFPPGQYFFQNISGGALSGLKIWFYGIASRK